MADVCHETSRVIFCDVCKTGISKPNYLEVYVRVDKFKILYQSNHGRNIKEWPMSIGSLRSLILHEDVVTELKDNNISGLRFHKITQIGGKILDVLPPPPSYYKVEPTGYAEFIPAAEKYEILDCPCGIRPKYFGEFKAPFEISKPPASHEDFFCLKHFPFWVCVTRQVIDVIVKNKWTDYFQIGDRALPGMRIMEFGASWHEDTLEKLREQFPESTILE